MLADEVKKLEEENIKLTQECAKLRIEKNASAALAESYKKCCMMIIPEKLYTHKARKNTTVKFRDGSSVTVKRKRGEKDCLETAIAYCILKQLLTAEDVKELIKKREEH